ncbi:hypothetical protein [Salinimicrobium oceani]|uniref:MG2 domain-containing protein n=1 Tax=Salinimicrobium oceani TaxID=2722702 RepID=A0ABX1CUL2_9FLAO|nr:hypothetical protein [Salinimicrobium oceani]NJW51585.1 hypothetical protein [Salinimicrobium oceani]
MKKRDLNMWIGRISAFLLLVLAIPENSFCQIKMADEMQVREALKSFPQEKVHLHYNSTFLLSGEYLYYKIYLLNSISGLENSLSKIAYVELKSENGSSVFRQKVRIDGGTGQGDFFIPAHLPTGSYKLLAYTQWMLNESNWDKIFQGDLVIVNPYTSDRTVDIPREGIKNDSILFQAKKSLDDLKEDLAVPNYDRRSQVSVDISQFAELDPEGTYSVSVRKQLKVKVPKMTNPEEISRTSGNISLSGSNSEILLPEVRGEIIAGYIIPKNVNEVDGLQDKHVALSIPGENFELKISATDEHGLFLFNVEAGSGGEEALIQIIGKDREDFMIELQPFPAFEPSVLFSEFKIGPEIEEILVEESVYNQIENAYAVVKKDTVSKKPGQLPFYGDLLVTYELGDYTRFNSLKETLVEIVRDITVKKTAAGELLKTRGENSLVDSEMPSLLLVDGVVVQDHELLINYPARSIRSIGILREKYFYGPQVFHGIIHVKTIEGNFFELLDKEDYTSATLLRPLLTKRYFKQEYKEGKEEENHIPDFRRQLLWNPKVMAKNGSIEFYTSDVPGLYELNIQGYSSAGIPISAKRIFRVN